MRRRALLLAALLVPVAVPRAAQLSLTLREVDEAILIGQSRIASDRARFHAPYRLIVSKAPVDYVDVVTPFRRVVLAADEHLQIGDRSFGQRQALDLLTAAGGQFDLVIEMTFHPLNTFVGVPDYDVALVKGAAHVAPASLDRQPRFGARLEGMPPSLPTPARRTGTAAAQPMLGGTITARFGGEAIDANGLMDLVVAEQGRELVRVPVDFAHLR